MPLPFESHRTLAQVTKDRNNAKIRKFRIENPTYNRDWKRRLKQQTLEIAEIIHRLRKLQTNL